MPNSLFVFGTLMFPEITFALLGHSVDPRSAVLKNFIRTTLERKESKAVGPVIVPDSSQVVRGLLLSNLSTQDLAIIHHFEQETKGYQLQPVKVELDDCSIAQTKAYQLEESLRGNTSGDWSEEGFKQNHLHYYVKERIPLLLKKWGIEHA